ncbi:LysR family transcriptional regulator [Ferrimonas senticii]|uniref:LysR family transcriptional regulator n=1 Tax=Ferrimonas senticii TaxID=394566 RepID=UPI00041A68F0|nr:LysR family transcriptional regulator [Ferrimonas senticii]
MNLDHLQLFVRVAATHNISAAGTELGLSAAVASSYINKLEQSLGVRLLHRTTRKVALTEEGMTLLPHAESLLAQVEVTKAAVGSGSVTPSGTLRITAPASFGCTHLMPRMSEFLARYPDLKLDLRFTDTVVDLVEGGFDVAIRNSALKDSSLIARKLAPDQRILTASPAYLAQHGTPQTPAELKQHQCLSLIGLEHWQFADGELSIRPQGPLRTDNGTALKQACVAGLGIAISATWSVYQELQRGELVQVLAQYPLYNQAAVWAVYPSSQLLAPKVRAFIDFFADAYGDPPYWDRALIGCSANS